MEYSGWADIGQQGWVCQPKFPHIFPNGVCDFPSASVCQNFSYHQNGSDHEKTFRCNCSDYSCSSDSDCNGIFVGSKCNPQTGKCKLRVGWNSDMTGPVCVPDTCKPGETWKAKEDSGSPYGIAGSCIATEK